MGYVKDVLNAQAEVRAAKRGDRDADMDRERAVAIATDRRNATVAGHGPQPGTPGSGRRQR